MIGLRAPAIGLALLLVGSSLDASAHSSRGGRRHATRSERSAHPLPREQILARSKVPRFALNVPQEHQSTDTSCHSTSLMSVINYLNPKKWWDPGERAFAREMTYDRHTGGEPTDLVREAKRWGVKATIKNGMTVAELAKLVNNRVDRNGRVVKLGRPVVVPYQAWAVGDPPRRNQVATKDGKGWEWKTIRDRNGKVHQENAYLWGHYSVVIAVDKKFVYLQDPAKGGTRGKLPHADFARRWRLLDEKSRPSLVGTGIVFPSKLPGRPLNTVRVDWADYVPMWNSLDATFKIAE